MTRALLIGYLGLSLLFWATIVFGIVRLPDVQQFAVNFYVAHGNEPWFVVLVFALCMGVLNLRKLR